MTDVKWIKICTTMFEDEKIRLIESMPEADTVLIIWVKLLIQAGKTNASGYIYLNEQIPYTEEMLSTIFNRPLNTVRMALGIFKNFEMIEIADNDFIGISNWEKHQNVDGLDKIREQNKIRAKKFREKQKMLLGAPKELPEPKKEDEKRNVTDNVTGNVTVTQSNATDIELELELEKEKELRTKDKNIVDKSTPPIPFSEIINYLNGKAGTKYRATTTKTKNLITARFREGFTLDDFITVIDNKVEDSKNPKIFDPRYLRPETLFGTKFEGYLNQKPRGGGPGGKNEPSKGFAEKYDLPF